MTIMEAINARHSVRAYKDTPIPHDVRDQLDSFVKACNDESRLNITIRYDDPAGFDSRLAHYGSFSNVRNYIVLKRSKCADFDFICGYFGEKIVLFAESLGIGTTWIAGTMDRSAFEKAVELAPGEVMPCVSPLGYPAKKMSIRESMMRKGIKADTRMTFGELFFDGSFDKPLTAERAGRLAEALEGVRLAPSAVNKQPWRAVVCGDKTHFYEKRSKGYVSPDGWDIQKIDMGIALCHFELAAEESGLEVSMEICDPSLPGQEDLVYTATFTVRQIPE